MKAHVIKDGKIVNTIIVDSLDLFPDLIDASVGGNIGDHWDGEKIVIIEKSKAEKKAENAAARYAKEISGVYYDGHLILTEREDINILNSAMEKIRRGLVEAIEWKCGDGSYLVLDSSNISEIEILVLTHIQESFAKEKYYNYLIDQGVEVDFIY